VRAHRFALQVPLRYRTLDDPVWRDGRTVNISRTGVLFLAADGLQVDTPVEMSLQLRVADLPTEVCCHGRVVRAVPPGDKGVSPVLAATIADYTLQRARREA
jgi:hypothetical protein